MARHDGSDTQHLSTRIYGCESEDASFNITIEEECNENVNQVRVLPHEGSTFSFVLPRAGAQCQSSDEA